MLSSCGSVDGSSVCRHMRPVMSASVYGNALQGRSPPADVGTMRHAPSSNSIGMGAAAVPGSAAAAAPQPPRTIVRQSWSSKEMKVSFCLPPPLGSPLGLGGAGASRRSSSGYGSTPSTPPLPSPVNGGCSEAAGYPGGSSLAPAAATAGSHSHHPKPPSYHHHQQHHYPSQQMWAHPAVPLYQRTGSSGGGGSGGGAGVSGQLSSTPPRPPTHPPGGGRGGSGSGAVAAAAAPSFSADAVRPFPGVTAAPTSAFAAASCMHPAASGVNNLVKVMAGGVAEVGGEEAQIRPQPQHKGAAQAAAKGSGASTGGAADDATAIHKSAAVAAAAAAAASDSDTVGEPSGGDIAAADGGGYR
ncbi:hypothetical protein Vretimale_16769 [Volvox reticuliferus]|uniref:Uncharacterized protein n=1 Tax=Volvox reticuliferus TaxID=1737510 RepID=A0A8J4GTM2_9CHLO|nr:hypothetical protein Vretimale_16769 [Volvox reticuliferus]